MKQRSMHYAIQSVFAVGPYNILTLPVETSPFNIRAAVAVHFFSEREVAGLLQQFAQSNGIALDPAVARDIFELTAGHAGLVCACGRALESVGALRSLCTASDSDPPANLSTTSERYPRIRISHALWLPWRIEHMVASVSNWPTIKHMADSVVRLPALARSILEHAIFAGEEPLVVAATAHQSYIDSVRLLAGEGWLRPLLALDAEDRFKFTSPLVRTIAMNRLANLRPPAFPLLLPTTPSGALDVPAVILQSVTSFRAASFLSSLRFSTKVSKERVPNEASYHFELYTALCLRLCNLCNYGDVFPEADVIDAPTAKRFADILIVGHDASKHLVELVASAGAKSVAEHYKRLMEYMTVHAASGTCVAFSVSADLRVFDGALLEWPTTEQQSTGLVAIHVVHDNLFCAALAFTLRPGNAEPIKTVLQMSGQSRFKGSVQD